MPQITQTLNPTSVSIWERWLEKNHRTKKEIWIIFFKKSTGKQKLTYHEVLDVALCYGWIDGIEKKLDEERFALRFTPRRPQSKWSEINVKRFKELLKTGRVTEDGKSAFDRKTHIYGSMSNKKGAIEWHLKNKMPKNPTLEERIHWHKEHQKFCSCRPIPDSLIEYVQ